MNENYNIQQGFASMLNSIPGIFPGNNYPSLAQQTQPSQQQQQQQSAPGTMPFTAGNLGLQLLKYSPGLLGHFADLLSSGGSSKKKKKKN